MMNKYLHGVAFILTVVGALNWGFIGLFNYNLVMALFGSMPQVAQAVYVAVGLSALYLAFTHPMDCKMCMEMGKRRR